MKNYYQHWTKLTKVNLEVIMTHNLLTRDQFRTQVFERDNHRCVICSNPAQDAHHILERRLWNDGGYYLANGASVCGSCHILCEETTISVEDVRIAAKITKPIVPEHLYHDVQYDKWGNIILENGQRIRGELFDDPSVQKILSKYLDQFTDKIKYPRTYHLPWSPGITSDDRMIKSTDIFQGQRVIITEKMDGENSNLYPDYIHARSIDSRNHPSRNWLKNFWSQICGDIPNGYRICGENLYAKHSIEYHSLNTYFMGFSIWNGLKCLSWDETTEWFELLGIQPVPVKYDGVWDEEFCKHIQLNYHNQEGYVVRLASEFSYKDFRNSVAKFVRKDHVAPSAHHWFGRTVVPNQLKV